jgi:hypothetical protein
MPLGCQGGQKRKALPAEGPSRLFLVLPTSVWTEHVVTFLRPSEALMLGCTGRHFRPLVQDSALPLDGKVVVPLSHLREALTSFPRCPRINLSAPTAAVRDGAFADDSLAPWLQAHGGGLTRIDVDPHSPASFPPPGVLWPALLRSAPLPALRNASLSFPHDHCRALVTGGRLARMQELEVTITEPALEAAWETLALLPIHCPLLTDLVVDVLDMFPPFLEPPQEGQGQGGMDALRNGAHAFIPPSLKTLMLFSHEDQGGVLMSALRSGLNSSCARLESLTLEDVWVLPGRAQEELAEVLRFCAPTLRRLTLHYTPSAVLRTPLRGLSPGVLSALAACKALEEVELPLETFEGAFPPGTVFPRLTTAKVGRSVSRVGGDHNLDANPSRLDP